MQRKISGHGRGFSYVGACQVVMGVYMFASQCVSRLARGVQALTLPQRSGRDDGPLVFGSTSKTPRGAHSAIRAQDAYHPAHEIEYASNDAHSLSRAREVDSLSQKPARAIVPHQSLRGPAVGYRLSRHGAAVSFSLADGRPDPTEQFARDGHGGRLATAATSNAAEQELDLFVGANGRPCRLLHDPAKVRRTGFGDVTGPLLAAGGVDGGVESGETRDRLTMRKSLKVAHLSQDRRGGDHGHPGEAGKDRIGRCENRPPNHFLNGSFGLSDLSLGEGQLVDTVPQHVHVGSRQLGALRFEVADQAVALQSDGTWAVVGVHDRLDAAEDSRVLPREAMSVPGDVAKELDFQGGGVAGGQSTGRQQLGDVEGIFAVGLESAAGQSTGLGRVGQHEFLDDRFKHLPQPAIEADRFNRHGMGPRQGGEIVDDLLPTLAGNLLVRDFATTTTECTSGQYILVQVNPDAPMMIERSGHNRKLHVRGRSNKRANEKCNVFSRPLHGFTLVELLVVIAIIGVLVALLIPAVQSAREAARLTQCRNHLRQLALAMLVHEDAYGHLPGDGWGAAWVGDADRGGGLKQPGNWVYQTLPFIEEQAIHDIPRDGRPETITPRQMEQALHMAAIPIPWFNCPSARPNQLYPLKPYRANWQFRNTLQPDATPRPDYVANFGDTEHRFLEGPPSIAAAAEGVGFDPNVVTGLVFAGSAIRLQQIPDGMSKTYLVGEKALQAADWAGDVPAGQSAIGLHHLGQGWVTSAYWPPARDRPDFPEIFRYGSRHPGGFPVAMADGSVHVMDYDIDHVAHRANANRADGGSGTAARP